MRIISGTAKGHTIQAPKGMDTRPTQDRVRESICNVIQSRRGFFETQVLDLFSGTGALAIESLSRGASHAIAVDTRTDTCIKKNAQHCKVEDRLEIMKCTMESALSRLQGKQFQLIFSDPPYEKGYIQKTLDLVEELQLLTEDGFLILERHKNETLELLPKWMLVKALSFGYTRVDILCREP